MLNRISRCVKINNWIFEVKMVRAIRAQDYGQPYSAIANINLNGDKSYVDGLMTNSGDEFSRFDFNSFKVFLQQLDIKQAQFDRFKHDKAIFHSFDIPSTSPDYNGVQLMGVG